MILRLALVVFFASHFAYGQSVDTLLSPLDTLGVSILQLDSIQTSAAHEFSAIKNSYDSVMMAAQDQTANLNRRVDSLRNLNMPVNHLSRKLDSIQHWKDEKVSKLTTKIDKLRSDVDEKLNSLGLPPDLKEKANELSSAMDKLDVSLPDYDLSLPFNQDVTLDLPGIENPLGSQSLPDALPVDLGSGSLGEVGEQINQYQDQLVGAPKNLDDVSSLAEEKVTQAVGGGDLQKELGEVGKLQDMAGSIPDQEAVKEELVQAAQQQAVDHFAGKEEALQKAMETLAKYKRKYSSVESLDNLPKKRPNEMKGKPLIERLTPGIAFQIHRKDNWMVDFNPYVGYRFNTRLTAGVGWNQRVAYDVDLHRFDAGLRIYGPRAYGSFRVGEGFSGRIELEYMNTWVPPRFSSGRKDLQGREWVFGVMAGITKEYRFFKTIKGTFHILYNLHDPDHRSPYQDKLIMRIGFEFPMKKKIKRHLTD